jgi:hypothetical protein
MAACADLGSSFLRPTDRELVALGIHPGEAFAGGPQTDPDLNLARISRGADAVVRDGDRQAVSLCRGAYRDNAGLAHAPKPVYDRILEKGC